MTGVITGILTDASLRSENAVEALLLGDAEGAAAWGG